MLQLGNMSFKKERHSDQASMPDDTGTANLYVGWFDHDKEILVSVNYTLLTSRLYTFQSTRIIFCFKV